jgi:hypothetical protein
MSAGPQGVQGIQGVKGDQGLQGPTGLQGVQGPAGSGGGGASLTSTSNIVITAPSGVGINTTPTVTLDVLGQIRGRVVLSNWAGPTGAVDFTSSTGNSIYNYITNTGFNALTLGNPGSGYVGCYSVIKNNTTTGLSIALTYATGATGPASPLLLYSSNAATLIWSGPTGGYVQF